jgi:transcriptional regulator of arginine metabolism
VRDRAERLRSIRRIIGEHRITSQEMLLSFLKDEGISVTQATLSRDLKLLRVRKVSEGTSGYCYTLASEDQLRENEVNYLQDLRRGFISVEFSGNLAIVRTVAGHADTVGIALDNLGMEDILGTIAGDDTVLVVLREDTTRHHFVRDLDERAPRLGAGL